MSEVVLGSHNERVTPDLKGTGVWDITVLGPEGEKVYSSWAGARTHHVIRTLRDELARWRPWYRHRRVRRHLFGKGITKDDYSIFNISAPVHGFHGPTPFVLGEPHTLVIEDEDGKVWEATLLLPEGTERASFATANAGSERRIYFTVG